MLIVKSLRLKCQNYLIFLKFIEITHKSAKNYLIQNSYYP